MNSGSNNSLWNTIDESIRNYCYEHGIFKTTLSPYLISRIVNDVYDKFIIRTKESDFMYKSNYTTAYVKVKSNEELLQDAITEHKMKAIRSDILDNLSYILNKVDATMTRNDYNAIIKINEAIDKLTAEI